MPFYPDRILFVAFEPLPLLAVFERGASAALRGDRPPLEAGLTSPWNDLFQIQRVVYGFFACIKFTEFFPT